MKPFKKKLIGGIALIVILNIALLFILFSENPQDLWIAMIFIIGFKAGIVVWLYLNKKESNRIKAKRQSEKRR